MNKLPPDAGLTQCPLCHGNGRLRRRDLIAILSHSRFAERAAAWLAEIREKRPSTGAAAEESFADQVRHGPNVLLWRRSPKE